MRDVGYVLSGDRKDDGRKVEIEVMADGDRGRVYRSIYTDKNGRIAMGLCFARAEPSWKQQLILDIVTCSGAGLLAVLLFRVLS